MEQLPQLIEALNHLADAMGAATSRTYTITGAADWPILAVLGGILCGLIAFMWVDLRATMKDHKGELETVVDRHIKSDEKGFDLVWAEFRSLRGEMKECKEKCCDG